jgi:GT2 family glycosyltransferase
VLRETLVALVSLDYDRSSYEVIVVDDGADKLTGTILGEFSGHGVEMVLESQDRCGAAVARNRGAHLAGGDLLLFVDDDMIVRPDHLRRHQQTRHRYGDVLVNGTWVFSPEVLRALRATPFGRFRIELEQRFQQQSIRTLLEDGCAEVRALSAFNLCLSREVFWDLGGFDQDFPFAGPEDQDFSLRARRAGWPLLLNTGIRCLHNDGCVTLHQYCAREERSAQGMPVLARKHPDEVGDIPYIRDNRPIEATDPPRLVIKKLVKAVLATRAVLPMLHRITAALEKLHLKEGMLRRLYSGLLGLHLFRGFRSAWIS